MIGNNPRIEGSSNIFPLSSTYGITLKEELPADKITPTLMHEISHWATGNAQDADWVNKINSTFLFRNNTRYIGDIIRNNESLVPNIPMHKAIKNISTRKGTLESKINRYNYLIDPQEKRARAMSIYQAAKDANMSTDEFIDTYSKAGKIVQTAPEYLRAMGNILTVEDLKKYIKNFLSLSAPIGISSLSKMKNTQNSNE